MPLLVERILKEKMTVVDSRGHVIISAEKKKFYRMPPGDIDGIFTYPLQRLNVAVATARTARKCGRLGVGAVKYLLLF